MRTMRLAQVAPGGVPPRGRGSAVPARIASAACCFVALSAPIWGSSRVRAAISSPRRSRSQFAPASRSRTVAVMAGGSKSAAKMEDMFGGGKGVIVPAPSGKPDSTVVFMHGLGDTADGWASAFPLASLPNTQFVLPTADTVPVTLNGGYRMPSWFNIFGLDASAPDDKDGILAAKDRVEAIVAAQVSGGIPRSRIVVGGFSQGGAVALSYGLTATERCAGVVAMSTWAPKAILDGEIGDPIKEMKVLMCHGDSDAVVSPTFGKMSAEAMKSLSIDVELKSYPGLQHGASPQELADVEKFLSACLS